MTIITSVSPFMVRATGLEPAQEVPLEPKSNASANSATPAFRKRTHARMDTQQSTIAKNPQVVQVSFRIHKTAVR